MNLDQWVVNKELPLCLSLRNLTREAHPLVAGGRFRAKRKHPERVRGLLPESHGHNLALAVLYVPYSLEGGRAAEIHSFGERSIEDQRFPRQLTSHRLSAIPERGGGKKLEDAHAVDGGARSSCMEVFPQHSATILVVTKIRKLTNAGKRGGFLSS